MKGKMRKIIIITSCLLLSIWIFTGCGNVWLFPVFSYGCKSAMPPSRQYEERESGDFVVHFYEDYCEIKGTTEQGNNKKFLVIPAYIEGVRVDSLGAYNPFNSIGMVNSEYYSPVINSEKLEKMYFESAIKYYPSLGSSATPNLRKVFFIEVADPSIDSNRVRYYPSKVYEAHEELALQDPKRTSYAPANVSYYYNYENARNGGYYWIDDCDYGGKIEFIPTPPTRDGYTFGGWYKEPECVNAWDFENDVLPEKESEMKEDIYGHLYEDVVYKETALYAKWE